MSRVKVILLATLLLLAFFTVLSYYFFFQEIKIEETRRVIHLDFGQHLEKLRTKENSTKLELTNGTHTLTQQAETEISKPLMLHFGGIPTDRCDSLMWELEQDPKIFTSTQELVLFDEKNNRICNTTFQLTFLALGEFNAFFRMIQKDTPPLEIVKVTLVVNVIDQNPTPKEENTLVELPPTEQSSPTSEQQNPLAPQEKR
eukprot:TRINITY_DN4078_c0_g1_i1.p1 TRINITY_DN4078_c0_g1~~TRINITY_DN4078_c0_g1_i1.p1  ORF type:complete len:201 (-),score=63.39 TRINITY_DN4078_c0_g1_i1:182-784(-)